MKCKRIGRARAGLAAGVLAIPLYLSGCDAPMWRAAWPKPKPVTVERCGPEAKEPEDRKLVVEAELDYDDGHVKRWMLVDRALPKQTPDTPELAKVGDCYSDAVDLQPHAKGKVVVEYQPREGATHVCLVRSAIEDGVFVACVMNGLRSIPPAWFGKGRDASIVSIDFQPATEAASRQWYGTGEMRWDGDQAPRLKDVPSSD